MIGQSCTPTWLNLSVLGFLVLFQQAFAHPVPMQAVKPCRLDVGNPGICKCSCIYYRFLFIYPHQTDFCLSATEARASNIASGAGHVVLPREHHRYIYIYTYECFQKWRIQNLWSHACCISANHTPNHAPESYLRIIPRLIPMISTRECETYPETYPRNIPPKHTSNHTPWCKHALLGTEFSERAIYACISDYACIFTSIILTSTWWLDDVE